MGLITAWLLEAEGRFYVLLVLLSPALLPIGLWILMTGRTQNTPDNPAWWTVGFNAVSLLGVGLGALAWGWLEGWW